MHGLMLKAAPSACRDIGLSAGSFAACLTAVMLVAGTMRAHSASAIPQFASADFGWQSNLEDWEDPPESGGTRPARPFPQESARGRTSFA